MGHAEIQCTRLLQHLALAQTVMSLAKDGHTPVWDPKEPIPKDGLVAKHLKELQRPLQQLGAHFTLKLVERVISNINAGEYSTEHCHVNLRAVNERLAHEFGDIHLFTIAPEASAYLRDASLFGPEVEAKFPNMSEDIMEAGKCLGLQRTTAAVFHLMRVMELAVRKLGAELGISLVEEKNWQNILDEVNKAIKRLDHREKRTKELFGVRASVTDLAS